MQTPLVPTGVWDGKGSRDLSPPLPPVKQPRPARALRGRRAQNARPSFCYKMRVAKKNKNKKKIQANKRKKKKRLPLEMITGAAPALFRHRNTGTRVLPSAGSVRRAEKTGSLNHCVADVVARKKATGRSVHAECPAVRLLH